MGNISNRINTASEMGMTKEIHPSKWILLVIILFVTYACMHQKCWNAAMSVSRLDLLHSLVNNGTFAIDRYHENTRDKAIAMGHYFCDKAPGLCLLALPSFYASVQILRSLGISEESEEGWFLSSWITVALSVAVVTSIGVACIWLWLARFVGPTKSLFAAYVLAFGTLVFPYATLLMSHAVVVGLLGIALWALDFRPCCSARKSKQGKAQNISLMAGFVCGLSLASEYDSGLVILGIVVALAVHDKTKVLWFIAGGLPAVALIPLYNWICIGSPWSLPYAHEAFFTEMSKGFYGIHLPSAENAFHLLFSPERGLLFWTPFFALAALGYPKLYTCSPILFNLCYWVPFFQVVIISGNFNASAGWMFGPRYLAPVLPLLILPATLGLVQAPKAGVMLGLFSMVATTLATLISAAPEGANPLFRFYVAEWGAGHLTHNIGQVFGLPGIWSMLPVSLFAVTGTFWLWRSTRRAAGSHSKDVALAFPDFELKISHRTLQVPPS
jgi:hypothetical protein